MRPIAWLVYHYVDSGEIYHVASVPGVFPENGSVVDGDNNRVVRHIFEDELDDLNYSNPAQFLEENSWNGSAWESRGTRPSQYYTWQSGAWKVDSTYLMSEIRIQRSTKLGMSDWTQTNDSPLTEEKKAEWRVYRQALRDITGNLPADLDDPDDISWPAEPGS